MKYITIYKVKVQAEMGSNLTNCIRECIKLAAEEWRTIELIHNGNKYIIDPEKLFKTVFPSENK